MVSLPAVLQCCPRRNFLFLRRSVFCGLENYCLYLLDGKSDCLAVQNVNKNVRLFDTVVNIVAQNCGRKYHASRVAFIFSRYHDVFAVSPSVSWGLRLPQWSQEEVKAFSKVRA